MKRLVDDELLRKALYVIDAWERDCDYSLYWRDRDDAITALRTALEQPAVEPVAYLYHDARTPKDAHPWFHSTMLVLAADRRPGLRGETPLYTAPQAQQPAPVQEPDRTGMRYYKDDSCTAASADSPDCICWTPITAPQAQPRKAVKLTDEHVYKVVRSKQPHLSDTSAAWVQQFAQCKYWLSAAHSIGDEE